MHIIPGTIISIIFINFLPHILESLLLASNYRIGECNAHGNPLIIMKVIPRT
jgi:hypothetical protein